MDFNRITTITRGATRYLWARCTGGGCWVGVTLLVTMRCNQSCAYCDFPRHAGKELSTGEWLDLMAGLRRCGTIRLGLSGGEPLLRQDIGVLVQGAHDLGFITSMVTNGLLLEQRLDDVRGIDYLLCTIEGDQAGHDAVRGDGAWQRTIVGLEAAASLSHGPKLGIVCPVHRANVDEIEEPLEIAHRIGAQVFYQPVQERAGWAGKRFDGIPSEDLVRKAFKKIIDYKKSGRRVGNSMSYLSLVARGDWRKLARECSAGRFFVTVLPDGNVVPCCMVPFDEFGTKVDTSRPWESIPRVGRPRCAGCTIGPYVESHLMLSGDPRAVLNSLRWR